MDGVRSFGRGEGEGGRSVIYKGAVEAYQLRQSMPIRGKEKLDSRASSSPSASLFLQNLLILLLKFLGQHDSSIDRDRQTSMTTSNHDDAENELREDRESTRERVVVLQEIHRRSVTDSRNHRSKKEERECA